MDLMKQEYERRLDNLAKQIAAFKERKVGQTAAAKKKKVSFELPGDVSSSISENQDHKKTAFGLVKEQRSRGACEAFSNTSLSPSSGGMASWRLGRESTPTGSLLATRGGQISDRGEDLSVAGTTVHHPTGNR